LGYFEFLELWKWLVIAGMGFFIPVLVSAIGTFVETKDAIDLGPFVYQQWNHRSGTAKAFIETVFLEDS